ncbi:hypothetical protein ACU61A_40945 [Pseudonocardia sichuanensis]
MRSALVDMIASILPGVTTIERPPLVAPEKQLEVLGRVLLVVQRDCDVRDLMHSLDFWPALGGGYVLEWWEGLYANELHERMLDWLAEEGVCRWLRPSDIVVRTDIDSDDPEHRVFLLIQGVRVEFRSCEPVGLAAAEARRAQQLRRIANPDS